MNSTVDITLLQLVSAYIFVLLLLAIVKLKGIPREKEIIIATLRMTLQLILVGYLLTYLFDNSNPLFTILVILVMEVFAINNIFQRTKRTITWEMKKIVALAMFLGTLTGILYFILIVLQLSPWYDPRYIIPIAGMLIGNSMTGIALGINRLQDSIYSQKSVVETALMLGATPKAAVKNITDDAFDAAILPTINSMVGMGIVFLPGMMTGQILSGLDPMLAIKYQIAIMLGIVGCVAITVILFVQLGYQTFFNKYCQMEIG